MRAIVFVGIALLPTIMFWVHASARSGGWLDLACQGFWWLFAGLFAFAFVIGIIQRFDTETYHDEECFVGRSGLVCE